MTLTPGVLRTGDYWADFAIDRGIPDAIIRFFERLPADPDTTKGEESFVDVSPFIVANPEAATLIEPGKRSLDDPPPPAQAATVLRAAHRY